MKLNELAPKNRKKKIIFGRGDSAKKGNYCGRGGDGQNSRAGGGVRIGFEGGQTPLLRRMPKLRGFRNPNRKKTQIFNLSFLEKNFSDGAKISTEIFREKKIISKNFSGKIKILDGGEISKKFTIDAEISATAAEKIKKFGGEILAKKTE